MALAWKAGWVNALRGSNPLSSAETLLSSTDAGSARWAPHRTGTGVHSFWGDPPLASLVALVERHVDPLEALVPLRLCVRHVGAAVRLGQLDGVGERRQQ